MGEKDQPDLPIRALHDFLTEIEEEWGRFKNGKPPQHHHDNPTHAHVPSTLLHRDDTPTRVPDTLIALGIVVTLLYTIYLSYRQHVFYAKWEKRIALLLHLEEELMGN